MNKFAISVLVPFIALLLWVVTLERNISGGIPIKVRVEGYDPRDLLSGHYIRFKLSLNDITPCQNINHGESSCLCYGYDQDNREMAVPIWGGSCSEAPDYCVLRVQGTCEYSQFQSVDRYYIPEHLAPVLQTVPSESSIEVFLDRKGGAQVTKFFVGEETLEDFANRKLLELSHTKLPES